MTERWNRLLWKIRDLIDDWSKTQFENGIVPEDNAGMLMDKYRLCDIAQNKFKKRKSSQKIPSK